MHFYLGVTDNQWFTALQRDQASECNFWMPSGRSFGVLQPGKEFLFTLKAHPKISVSCICNAMLIR
jgi:putative restriction endonuclease